MKRAAPKPFDWDRITVVPNSRCGFLRWTKTHYVPPQWFSQIVRDFDLWIFCGGYGKLKANTGEIIDLKRGTIVYLRPDVIHEAWQEKGKEQITTLYLHHDLFCDGKKLKADTLADVPFWYETIDVGFYEIVARKILDLMNPHFPSEPNFFGTEELKQRRVEAAALLRSLILEFDHHARLARKFTKHGLLPQGNLVYDLLSRIYQNPECYATASNLATQAGYSPDHLARLFRQVLGKSPNQVIIEARVQKAQNLLATSHFTLSEIAEACGYQNVFYFSTQFKQKTGVSPSEFRKRPGLAD